MQLGVSLARNSIWRTSTKGEAHFCISRVRNAVAPNKKAASRRFKFCWAVIAARIRSLNPVGLGTGTRIPVSHRKPLLGHSRAFERVWICNACPCFNVYSGFAMTLFIFACDGYRAFGKVEHCPKVRNIAPFTAPENIRIYLIYATSDTDKNLVLCPCRDSLFQASKALVSRFADLFAGV